MKRVKFLICTVLCIICFAHTQTATAATGLSEAEEVILDKLEAGFEYNGIIIKIPVAYLNQVEVELMKNEKDIAEEQAEIINRKIDEAIMIVQSMKLSDFENIESSEVLKKLIKLVYEAAEVVDYTVSIDIADRTIEVINAEGKTAFIPKRVINQTGNDLMATAMIGSILMVLLITCVVIAVKMKLFAKTIEV